MRIILEYPCHESITIITVITIIKSICRVVKMQSLNLTYQFILSISVVTHWSQQENERRHRWNSIDGKNYYNIHVFNNAFDTMTIFLIRL